MEAVFSAIEKICPVTYKADMKKYTSFKIGGCADLLAEPENRSQLREVLKLSQDVPHIIIGNGTNLLFGDGGYRGVVLRLGSRFASVRAEGNRIYADAGASLGAVSRTAMENGLCGMAPLSGIPATVGGAVIMNAGAYGGEMADVIESVTYMTKEGEEVTSSDHGFSYRHSKYMGKDIVIVGAVFHLTEGNREEIKREMEELAQKRREKQPLTLPSAGSAFKRPKDGFAAKMIDEAGLRGFSVGGAAVSEKHAGFVVNTGNATADDVRRLLLAVQEKVKEAYGVLLEPEIQFVGEFI